MKGGDKATMSDSRENRCFRPKIIGRAVKVNHFIAVFLCGACQARSPRRGRES
jgi:hypothetical protein